MPRGRVCAWRGVRHVRGDTSPVHAPVTCSRGYTPAHICVTVVRQTRRAGERLTAPRRRRLSRSSQNRTPPCQRTPTQRIPPSNPCVLLHHQASLAYICEAQRSHTFANTARLIIIRPPLEFRPLVHFTNKSLPLCMGGPVPPPDLSHTTARIHIHDS